MGGLRTSNLKERSEKAESRTPSGVPFSYMVSVFSLNCLQNSAMLMPRGPSAWPMAGPGRAEPEGTLSLTWRRKDIWENEGEVVWCGLVGFTVVVSTDDVL